MAASQQPVLRFEHPVSIDATSTDPVPEAQDVKAISVDAVLVHYGTNVRRPDDDRSSSTCYPCCHNCQTCNTCRDSSPRGRNSDGCLVCCLGCCDDLCLDCASCFCCGRWYYTADGTVEHSEGYLCQDAGCNCPNPSESMKHPMDFIGCCEWIGKVSLCCRRYAVEISTNAGKGCTAAYIDFHMGMIRCVCVCRSSAVKG
eukprot:TRINITY_DN12298_c5_g2_i4.p1 TRINITY_DN12298_c5_g2~~TRINITY_DN12298_c5_g2_i4.p1  ORF type:complete len:200 (+),score=1.08 TRINITY_DN12298_c5_g2_i4:637-1236(+)